jgi:hypothetical protein
VIHELVLQARAAGRLVRSRPLSIRALVEPLSERLVFVVGCPRSGTTFLARSIGSCPGLLDLGEVAPLKAAVAELASLEPAIAGTRIRRILAVNRRLALVGSLRAVEQTPEAVFLAPALRAAFPRAQIVHIVRDGRDVVCSLLERGWLSTGRSGADDAGIGYGPRPRFWVEPERQAEFASASDARRAAWAWRRYVEAGLAAAEVVHEIRYEQLVTAPAEVAADLSRVLDVPASVLAAALSSAHADSVGRFRRQLAEPQLAEVEEEAGGLLRALGYLQ